MNWRGIKFYIAMLVCMANAFGYEVKAQRQYAAQSVLSQGNWYKISTHASGIYKIDIPFLNKLGFSGATFSSNSIRIFGNGGGMLPENNAIKRIDDLQEIAIKVVDGGDGILNGTDYLLFYSAGPHHWLADTLQKHFEYQKNLYSDSAYYFLSIGGIGKRITSSSTNLVANYSVNSFDEKLVIENDWINFLQSGKQWFGEEWNNLPGGQMRRSFNFSGLDAVNDSKAKLQISVAARSVGAASNLAIQINGVQQAPMVLGGVSGNFLDAFATAQKSIFDFNFSANSLNVETQLNASVQGVQVWLDQISLQYERKLSLLNHNSIEFAKWSSIGSGRITKFFLDSQQPVEIWDITNDAEPIQQMYSAINGAVEFVATTERFKKFIAFQNSAFKEPGIIGRVINQNLHQSSPTQYIIVTPTMFLVEANRLANFHQQFNQLNVTVVEVEKIYNEFAGGTPDPTAIRDFVKMYFDKAGADTNARPKYLLLFGAASFDYKNRVANNSNWIPSYQSMNSLDPLITHTSDDFFALLDDQDDINLTAPPGLLDIAVGRIPARSVVEAKNMVDKVISYHNIQNTGSWQNNFIIVADDKDGNIHLNDGELIASNIQQARPVVNINKIYLDAFPAERGAGGVRYPLVNQTLVNALQEGALIFNYVGHGGSERLADEAIFGSEEFKRLNNASKLPLFITATCDFAPFDNPTKKSLGEELLVKDTTGAIALITTTRLVFAYSNSVLNSNFIKIGLSEDPSGNQLTLGEAMRRSKNLTYQNLTDVLNNRKFALLGDPAMQLAFPKLNIILDSLNDRPVQHDTLKGLGRYVVVGSIRDANRQVQHNFNGEVQVKIFNAPQKIKTRGNDPQSNVVEFMQQTALVFNGNAKVQEGKFKIDFILPKDVGFQIGKSKISMFAKSDQRTATGMYDQILIGGVNTNVIADNQGPNIQLYLNDLHFRNNGITSGNPLLIAQLFDTSGINTVGVGIGHDITLVIDDDERNPIVLNTFFATELGNFRKGKLQYQLPKLSIGKHKIRLKAWDNYNNSSTETLNFEVVNEEKIILKNLRNFPNPFSNSTQFAFEHNLPRGSAKLQFSVYTLDGNSVFVKETNVFIEGNRYVSESWNGTDNFGRKLQRGMYIYKVMVSTPHFKKAQLIGKFYLL